MSDNHDTEGTKFVIFLDSFGNKDLEHTPWISEAFEWGACDFSPVYVTPVALGSVYTGENPATHGLPAVSKYDPDQDPRLRPAAPTIPEIAAGSTEYGSVIQFGLPFIVPPNVDANGTYWHKSEAMGQQSIMPQEAAAQMTIAGPAGDISKPSENMGLAFDMRVDHLQSTFGSARNLAESQEADVMFISYRGLDSYCHYQFDGPKEGDDIADEWAEYDKNYREMLLEEVDRQVKYCCDQGEVFVFGDHGAQAMKDTFRLNRWLMKNDYLDVEIDYEWREKAKEYGTLEEQEDVPGTTIATGDPGVTVNEEESVAITSDPFSGGITLLEGANREEYENLVADLEEHPAVKEVVVTDDEWNGPLLEECPHLYVHRNDGWFVSGNLADEKGGPELTRSGVHHPIGFFGANNGMDLPGDVIDPEDLFHVIAEDYLELDPEEALSMGDVSQVQLSDEDQEQMQKHLEDMGYM